MASPLSTPTRSTSEGQLDQFNIWLRSQPWYGQLRERYGPGALSRAEQADLEQALSQHGIQVPSGMHIDQGGNLNQKNRLGRNAIITAGVTGAAFGVPAIAGVLGGGGGAAGGVATGGASGLSAGMFPGLTAGLGTAGTGTVATGGAGALSAGMFPGVTPGLGYAGGAGGSSVVAPTVGATASRGVGRRILDGITSPEGLAAIATGGLGFASNMLQNRANEEQAEADRQQRTRELMASILGDQSSEDFARQQAYMGTFAMNPVSQAGDIFRTAARGSIAGAGPLQITPEGVSGGAQAQLAANAAQYLNPDALAENASRFYSAAGQLNPYAQQPDLAGMGLPGGRQAALTQNIMEAQRRQEQAQADRRNALLMGGQGGAQATPRAPGQTDYFTRRSPLEPRF